MKAIRSWSTPNPILVKELRSRMRGARAFITLTVALTIMALMMIGLTSLMTQASNTIGNLLSPQIGQVLFEGLINFELLLVCTVTPAVTAGAISSEREKLTFEMLLATPLGAARIVWGKLISALSYVFVLILAAIPLASLVFLFGGVAPLTMVKALFILVVVAVTLGIYGLFLSALLGRTGRATVVGFVSVMVMAIGPMIALIANGLFYGSRITMPRMLLAFSPVSMLISAVESASTTNSGGVSGLFNFVAGQWDPSLNPVALTQIPRPIYHYSLAICGVVSIVLFTLTVALINPARRFYLSKRTALTGGATLAAFAAVVVAAYLLTAPRYEWIQATRGEVNQVNAQVAFPAQAVAVQAVPAATWPAGGTPGPTPTVITARGANMAKDEQIAIYAEVARQVALKDSTAGTETKFPIIYLVIKTDDRSGAPEQPNAGAMAFNPDQMAGISAALKDLAPEIQWVGGLDEIPTDAKSGKINNNGLMITFGNIQVQPDNSVQVPASAYLAADLGGGQTYRLEKTGSTWKITGTVGGRWIK